MWLPHALADIYAVLIALYRPNLKEPSTLKIPERHEILAAWCLPMLARSLKADADERAALEILESVKRLKKKATKNDHQSQ